MIEVEQVSFSYAGSLAGLQDVSFTVRKGECVLLCGESGCGKTTVTKLINGLIPNFTEGCSLQGTVRAEGLPVKDTELYQLARKIGSVFQNPKSQFFNLDTDSELAFGLENQGTAPELLQKRIQMTVQNLQIQKLMGRNIFSLSGGEKQMLAFASVYAMDPAVFVMDEPTANLDYRAIKQLQQQICLLKEQGHTVLVAEHRLYFLADIIDRALYFQSGRLIREFSGKEFLHLPDRERKQLGLRVIREPELSLPPAESHTAGRGLLVRDLTCGYPGKPPLFEHLSFSVEPGKVLAITGYNGTGKTTLVRCLCGLLKEQAGKILLNGRQMNRKERRRNSFLVMQDVNHQLFCDSVWNECQQAAGKQTLQEKIVRVLEEFELLSWKEQHPMALSGGQKQRLAMATAVLSNRKVLIFDEPTSGLDYRRMKSVGRAVRRLAEQGHIVLVVSHDREFMAEACDQVCMLPSGLDCRNHSGREETG